MSLNSVFPPLNNHFTFLNPKYEEVNIYIWDGGENLAKSGGKYKEVKVDRLRSSQTLEDEYFKIVTPYSFTNGYLFPPPYKAGINQEQLMGSPFDAGQSYFSLKLAIAQLNRFGFKPAFPQKIEVQLNTLDWGIALFSPHTWEIYICKWLGADGDVPLHELGHADLQAVLPQMGMSTNDVNGFAFHEYYADVFAASINRNWQIAESANIFLSDERFPSRSEGLRNPLKSTFKYDDPNLSTESHERSLVFSGAMANIYKELIAKLNLTEAQAFDCVFALLKNQVHFLPNATDLKNPEDFYFSLVWGWQKAVKNSVIKNIFRDHPKTDWEKRVTVIISDACQERKFISPERAFLTANTVTSIPEKFEQQLSDVTQTAVSGGTVGIKRQVVDVEIAGVSRGVEVLGHRVIEVGNGLYDIRGLKNLADIKLIYSRELSVPIARIKLYDLLRTDLERRKTIAKLFNVPANKEWIQNADLPVDGIAGAIDKKIGDFLKSPAVKDDEIKMVIADGFSNVQYQIPCGPLWAFVDIETGNVEFTKRVLVDTWK